ncbi:MAG: zinc-binding alcohol dehydrogenase family protein [Bacteroidota bacterium]|nr:zinc-binding alcohol dehydrogenase family protein [Bacteroidota bacterium]
MKALCVQTPNQLVIEERPQPQIQSPGEVLLKVKAGGICGSDMHIYHGTSSVATYPRVIGHEIAGEILAIGSSVSHFKVGDRVVMDPVISCGECYQCRIGRRNVCGKLQVRSVHVDGGYQEYLVLPEESIYRIPDGLTWEEAIMIEPFTIAEQVCSRAEIVPEDQVFIMGAGPVGLSILKMVKLYGATCFVSDIMDNKLAFATAYGADAVINVKNLSIQDEIKRLTNGNGATVVIDAACTKNSLEQAMECVCSAGRVITLGFGKDPSHIHQLSITAREIDIRGSRLHNNKFPQVIANFQSGKLQVKDMITHRFPFAEVQDALRLMEDPSMEKGKVVLLF